MSTRTIALSALAAATLLISTTSVAWDAQDQASNYPSGLIAYGSGNGGNGFAPWTAINLPDFGQFYAQDATLLSGGSAEMNTSGATFCLFTWTSLQSHTVERVFDGFSTAAGTRLRVQAQKDGSVGTVTVAFRNASSESLNLFGDPSTNWTLTDGTGSTDTGMAATTPINILLTQNSNASYDIAITELGGSGSWSATGRAFANTGFIDRMRFDATAISPAITLAFNQLTVDTTGTLPVELDTFRVE